MKIKLDYIQLHEPIFIGGVNLPNKLEPNGPKGPMDLYYDTDLRLWFIVFKGFVGFVSSVAGSVASNPKDLGFEEMQRTPYKSGPITTHQPQGTFPAHAQIGGPADVFKVQVSTPMDKVQGKPGAKKAKFQGEESQGE